MYPCCPGRSRLENTSAQRDNSKRQRPSEPSGASADTSHASSLGSARNMHFEGSSSASIAVGIFVAGFTPAVSSACSTMLAPKTETLQPLASTSDFRGTVAGPFSLLFLPPLPLASRSSNLRSNSSCNSCIRRFTQALKASTVTWPSTSRLLHQRGVQGHRGGVRQRIHRAHSGAGAGVVVVHAQQRQDGVVRAREHDVALAVHLQNDVVAALAHAEAQDHHAVRAQLPKIFEPLGAQVLAQLHAEAAGHRVLVQLEAATVEAHAALQHQKLAVSAGLRQL
eukprot:scaffold1208_cov231-Pinguiococcus_pyrenoidosus.AAC.3